jgi:hypothetical protein
MSPDEVCVATIVGDGPWVMITVLARLVFNLGNNTSYFAVSSLFLSSMPIILPKASHSSSLQKT